MNTIKMKKKPKSWKVKTHHKNSFFKRDSITLSLKRIRQNSDKRLQTTRKKELNYTRD